MAFKNSDHHWDFLDEIEAPTWVDLSLEANPKFNEQDIEDSWFYTTHQFHQCSSSHLKSVFSHGGDESLLGPLSPRLPHSVSKSRGKQYRSKKWNQGITFDNAHPVKVLTGNKPKPNSSSTYSNEASTSKSSLVTNCSKTLCVSEDHRISLSSKAGKTSGGSNPTSTVTTESSLEKLKGVDVSSHEYGQTNGLLSMMKKSLRKSYTTTRQVTRVEVKKDDVKQLRARSSISSKSSVGSSSYSSSVQPKEITPESRSVQPPRLKIEERASNNRRTQVNTLKPARNEAAKQKVLYRDSRTRALVPFGVNKQKSTLGSTELEKTNNAQVVSGGESIAGKDQREMKQPVLGKSIAGKDQREMKQSVLGKSNTAETICSKGIGRGRGNLEKPKNMVQRVHFR